MQNYKMIIAYDGRKYKGFRKTAANADKSIQGKMEAILNKLYEEEVEVISAVSTDAGVSAKYQVVHFKAPNDQLSATLVLDYFEQFLPDDILTLSVEKVDERFHSRYLVKGITYEYRLWKKDASRRPLFERHYVNTMDMSLNTIAMKEAAHLFLGEHDFTAFSTKSKIKSPVKEMLALDIEESEDEVVITMKANGYLLNMERIIVGTLIQIGLGERHMDTILKGFETRDNKDVGHKAMAHALCLIGVEY